MKIGDKIRRLREKKGLTQQELGEKIHMHQVYVHLLESGKKVSPTVRTRKKLAKALGVKLTNLLN
jgi:transcriptional regulator with XRE-family HTH domain